MAYFNDDNVRAIEQAIKKSLGEGPVTDAPAKPVIKDSLSSTGKSMDQLRREAIERSNARPVAPELPVRDDSVKRPVNQWSEEREKLMRELEAMKKKNFKK